MMLMNCERRNYCVFFSVITAIILGAFSILLLLTGGITVTDFNLIGMITIAVFYLAITLLTTAIARPRMVRGSTVGSLLTGIIGTIFLAAIVLLRGGAFPEVAYAIVVGFLLGFVVLMILSMVCFIKQLIRFND